ncbi:MAG: OmpA family protein [Bacteroidota bacterium]|nr:OmpA family protein [Candidatus Kapabacteria bacterium]MDW8074719.1 OmpA family protein [Bacteroidota bacterium]MDW8270805.1 OmpA family protein [Bacteroidota bacterium]
MVLRAIVLIVLILVPAWAQVAGIDTLSLRYLRSDGDTVVMLRSPGDWRVGPMLSGTYHMHFGKLIIPANLVCPTDGYLLLNSGGVGGGGIGIGGQYVYHPQGSLWGVSFMVSIVDIRQTTSVTRVPGLPLNPSFELDNTIVARNVLTYITFMPQARYYYTDYPGLHFLVGADIDVLTTKALERTDVRYNDEQIEVRRRIGFQPNYLRVGGHIGAGWDLFAGLIGTWRMTLTPFLTLHIGTTSYSRNGSNWNSAYLRGGAALTFGEDVVTETILPRNPNAQQAAPPALPVLTTQQINVPIPPTDGLYIATLLPTSEAVDIVPQPTAPTPARPLPPVRIVPNQLQIFTGYSSPTDTALTDELRRYLDALADYLKQNPRAEVRIVGHSDNFGGSPVETQRVSDERALQVVRYLMSKGIPRGRLLASGMGARNPIQSNRTPQGRMANRRVEITVVQ